MGTIALTGLIPVITGWLTDRWGRMPGGPCCRWCYQGRQRHGNETRSDGNVDNLVGTLDGVVLLDETVGSEDRNVGNLAGTLDGVVLLDETVGSEDRNVDNLAGTLDGVVLLDEMVGSDDGDADGVGLQVQAHATDAGGEFNNLLGC
jgi:hypothetical protein